LEIKSTKDIKPDKINMLIVGESGAGKTTLAKTLKGKTLIISCESGLLSLMGSEIDFVEVDSKNSAANVEVLKNILSSKQINNYDNIYIDSLTEIADYFLAYAKKEYPEEKQTQKMYGYYKQILTGFIKYVRDMDKNVFFTSLQKTDKDESGIRWNLPDIKGSLAYSANGYFDFVFNLQVVKKDDKDIRALLTQNRQGFTCKDRSGKLDEWEKPNLGSIIDKVFNNTGDVKNV